jgi:hypothetical protein
MKKVFSLTGLFLVTSFGYYMYAAGGMKNEIKYSHITSESKVLAAFSEEEDFDVSDEFAAAVGYSSFTIKKGDYQIVMNEDGSITATLDILNLVDNSTIGDLDDNSESGFGENGVAIRIAKRICKPHRKSCHCGIGFRCGITSTLLEYEDGNPVMQLKIKVDQKAMKIVFLLPEGTNVTTLGYE